MIPTQKKAEGKVVAPAALAPKLLQMWTDWATTDAK